MQATTLPLSSWQVNVAPASGEENVNVALALVTRPDGPLSIDVLGAVVSTVNERVAAVGSAFPAASVAMTLTVCGPSARPL